MRVGFGSLEYAPLRLAWASLPIILVGLLFPSAGLPRLDRLTAADEACEAAISRAARGRVGVRYSHVRYSPYDGGGGVVDPREFERRLEGQLDRSQRRAFRRRRWRMRPGAAVIVIGFVLLVLLFGFVAFLLVR